MWDMQKMLRVSYFICTFAPAKVRIALARMLTIP